MSEDRPLYEVLVEMGKDMPPPDAAEIAERVRQIARDLREAGADLSYIGGFGPLNSTGTWLRRLALAIHESADEIEGAQTWLRRLALAIHESADEIEEAQG